MDFLSFKEQYQIYLDQQQETAVQCIDGPVLLLAVPGSGKTTVLVTRLGYMRYVKLIPPHQILTMTYTVAAAKDMKNRYASFFGKEEADQLNFRTINGVCSQIIHLYERRTGRTAFRLLEDNGQRSNLLGELYRKQTNEHATEPIIKSIMTAITFVKNQMIRGEGLSEIQVEDVDFPALYQEYCRVLRAQRLMDYDDQMVYALQILQKCPEILDNIQKRYCYFCVDEAQDTSKIQHYIIQKLAHKSRNLFMVGDEDQSIYGFRAAYPQALTQFSTVYPEAIILYMEQNYRSKQKIVAVANQFIEKNHNRFPKHMKATQKHSGNVREISVYDRSKQYRYLAKIAGNCTEQTAVLYRDNDSALPLIDFLDRSGIPYACRQIESTFFSSRIVRDIVDMISFAKYPDDGELFLNIYYKLGAGISRIIAQEASSQASRAGESILEYIRHHPNVPSWTKQQCASLQTHFKKLMEENGDQAVYRIVHFMGYGVYLEERGMDTSKTEILQAIGADQPTPMDLVQRLTTLQEVVQAGKIRDQNCRFLLSTIHSSKGLEYDRVILMDIVDGIFPKILPNQSTATTEEWDSYEEERRLFYVGMTRAKNELLIISFRKKELQSTFVQEIFPKEEKEPKKHKYSLHIKKEPKREQIISMCKEFESGIRVMHKTFGAGTISTKNGDIVTIQFDSKNIKKISLSTALRTEQLKKLK